MKPYNKNFPWQPDDLMRIFSNKMTAPVIECLEKEAHPLTIGEISQKIGYTKTRTSQGLIALKNIGLAESQRSGGFLFFFLDLPKIAELRGIWERLKGFC